MAEVRDMTQKMKVITSLDEWWKAVQDDRLMVKRENKWTGSNYSGDEESRAVIAVIVQNIDEGNYAWAPEQVRLYRWEHKAFGSLYLPEGRVPEAGKDWTRGDLGVWEIQEQSDG